MEGSSPPLRSPQDKKKLGYANDRRNGFGENDKASRRLIPLRKSLENKSDRRKVGQSLSQLPHLDESAAELIESSARHDINRVGGWTKTPDIPLAAHISKRRG